MLIEPLMGYYIVKCDLACCQNFCGRNFPSHQVSKASLLEAWDPPQANPYTRVPQSQNFHKIILIQH